MRGDIWRGFLGISETKARAKFDYKVSEYSDICNFLFMDVFSGKCGRIG